jgi:hypothetical protein
VAAVAAAAATEAGCVLHRGGDGGGDGGGGDGCDDDHASTAVDWSGGQATALPALCSLVDGGACNVLYGQTVSGVSREGAMSETNRVRYDQTVSETRRVLAAVAAPGCRLGGRARFLAERSLNHMAGAPEAETGAGVGAGAGAGTGAGAGDAAQRGLGFSMGRGRGMKAPNRAISGGGGLGRLHDGNRGGTHAVTRAEVHATAAAELKVVVAKEGSVAAVERGMRQGWVFWYVGSPVSVSGVHSGVHDSYEQTVSSSSSGSSSVGSSSGGGSSGSGGGGGCSGGGSGRGDGGGSGGSGAGSGGGGGSGGDGPELAQRRSFVFSPEAAAAGEGRFVACPGGSRDWPTDGLPDDEDDDANGH